jgi:long-chain acyl-CoA synthetase
VSRFPSQIALDFLGATTTYRQLGDQVARAAEALRRLGVSHGDRVALVLPNCPQHVVAFYAVLRLGAIAIEHNPLYSGEELAQQLGDHDARVVICWEKVATTVRLVRGTIPLTIIAVDLTAALPLAARIGLRLPVPELRRRRRKMRGEQPLAEALSWERLVATTPPISESVPGPVVDDVAALQYTGGTTGVPKGAILTHRSLMANVAQGRAWVPGLRDGSETFLAALPLFHAFGLTLCLTFGIAMAAQIVLLPRFDVKQTLAAVRRCRPTFFPGVPPMYERLADAARAKGVSLRSIRYGISGAMPLPAATVVRWEALTGGLLVEGYGMTETSPVALGNPVAATRRPGFVGVPFPSTLVRIVDPDRPDRQRPRGERGELLINGPQVFSGYWNRPKETAVALLPGGWLRTGDIAVMDSDGFITIVDRIKELIITSGFNVYPSEVEEVLRGHPEIADAAVVGLPGGDAGESVVAAVVPRALARLDPDAIRRWCRDRIAGYKVPSQIKVVAGLPRNQVGKVLRRVVREEMTDSRQG